VSKKTILCVEDEELQLQLRKFLFESAGFRTTLARDCGEALEMLENNEVDAVVLDYRLAGSDGLAVAQEIKKRRPTVPIVMLSGSTSEPEESLGYVDCWFQKAQVEPEELIACVRGLVERATA
jgi:DNA-binding response OmpR family regulator